MMIDNDKRKIVRPMNENGSSWSAGPGLFNGRGSERPGPLVCRIQNAPGRSERREPVRTLRTIRSATDRRVRGKILSRTGRTRHRYRSRLPVCR